MAFGYNYLSLCLLGVSTCFFDGTAGYEAIMGGESMIYDHSFQYQVSLYINDRAKCGGGIISDFHVLTAARCVINDNGEMFNDPMIIRVGNKKNENMSFHVEVIFVPPEYKPQYHHTIPDFAVLKLSRSMKSINFERLKLPHDDYDHAGKKAWIAGFRTAKQPGMTLSHAVAEVFTHEKCREVYHHRRSIDKNQICASISKHDNEHRGVCHDDEGGPLVRYDGTVIGVLSVITGRCDETDLPAIYTRVSSYRENIVNYMREIGGVIKYPRHFGRNTILATIRNIVSHDTSTIFTSRHICISDHEEIVDGNGVLNPTSQVLLQVENVHDCGAGILSRQHVLTAAHCVINDNGDKFDSNMTIMADTYKMDEGMLFEIAEIRVPAEYSFHRHTVADIAVLKLSRPMLPTNFRTIADLKLPSSGHDYAFETAWTAVFRSMKSPHDTLLFIEVRVLSRFECQEAYHNRRTIDNSQICARSNHSTVASRGIFHGDEGGSLILRDGTVIGVLSVIPPHGTHLPAIYTRITSYRQNILHYTRGNGGVVHHQKNKGDWLRHWLNY